MVLVFILLGYWWMSQHGHKALSQPTKTPSSPLASTPGAPSPNSKPTTNAAIPKTPLNAASEHQAEVKRENKVWDLWLATPISFYGKVVDTDGNPIADASVSISMVDTPGPGEGHTKLQKKSDSNGMFSVSGHGLGLVVMVSKDGYYQTDKSSGNFGYSSVGGKTNPHPNPNDPAIFVLKKRGQTEPLIVTQGSVKIATDGSSRQMSLTTGHTWIVPKGDIVVQAWVQNQGIPVNSNKPYDWRCVITVPGGGIQAQTGGAFDFTAPESGYQSSDVIDMPATAKSWDQTASRSYFLKLANGDYARMDFTMIAGGDKFFTITAYLNPQPGHTNLEYDSDQATQPATP